MDNEMIEIKEKAKKQVLSDLRMYGIVCGIIALIYIIGYTTNLGGLRDGVTEISDSVFKICVAGVLATLIFSYFICSIGVGFKFLSVWLTDKISSQLLLGLIVMCGCVIAGVIVLTIRIIANTVCWIKANKKLKK